jgi:2-amino-4-hydroxy-6-hydroxymethyldihydropteridine diphosphokinase
VTPRSGAAASEWAWVALGANIGHRGRALACLRQSMIAGGVSLEMASPEILTRAVGVTNQGDFHNQVVLLRSPEPWTAARWLGLCNRAEEACGRRPTYRWGPRRADSDIVLLGREGEVVSHGDPVVPHPELPRRDFWRRLIAQMDAGLAARLEAGAAQMGNRSAS